MLSNPGYHARLYPVERTVGGVATGTGQYNAGGIGPHGLTNRWSITVPTNQAYRVESAWCLVMRETAAAAVGAAFARIQVAACDLMYVTHLLNTAGASAYFGLGECGFGQAGDVITGSTFDGSTGGTQTYSVAAHVRSLAI